MKLYYFQTPNAQKPCAVAKHVGSPVEFIHIDLAKGENKTPEYLAINPNGKIPALEDGDTRIWESSAMMCYLAQKANSDIWPDDPAKQIDIIRWLTWDTAHFSRHASTLVFQRYLKTFFGLGDPNESAIEEATGFFHQFAGVLNEHLKGRKYLVSEQLTVADFSIAGFLPMAKEGQLPLDNYDEINRWHGTMMELPAWREPYPA